ncbi:rod shape-determining protein MreC [Clostridium sp. D2Q-11]|uniref:Cell shape-determining protein MreC n=1 Tax=Anaeromonas frigoriresistens TaxID=2683708 RepID=A0A942UX11_9FIRM|nr:rod shape-determining protein MreC [Anaeromonas frigoriresistens]MBS4537177.1 rod shape-determining protein MreC [Anaeromonas frigoriresistens]
MSIFKKYGSRMIVTIVTIILLITIGITANDRERISNIENKIGKIITPVQGVFYRVGDVIGDKFSSVKEYINLKEKNAKLEKEVKILREENRKILEVVSKEEYLKNEMMLKESTEYDMISTRIISRDPENWFNNFVVNKGSKDGVSKNSPIIQAIETDEGVIEEGLVGIVIEVGDNWSKVLPIIDTGSNVSYKVIRTQDFGVVSGSIDQTMNGFLFDIDAEVVKGDKIISSGMGEVFIPGLYLGEVTDVRMKEEELKKEITVKPAVDFHKINNLFIINK